jgi:hypothetical protein
MSMMIPPAPPGTFRPGMALEGPVMSRAEFGLFIEFNYTVRGSRWILDGVLSFHRTPRPDEARACQFNERISVVVTDWSQTAQRLQLALPADPSWLTSDVVALARGIAADSAFDRIPILADALQEAGCIDEVLLHRCRFAPTEVSWLIPLLVGPESVAG